jgi:hypothetical protein
MSQCLSQLVDVSLSQSIQTGVYPAFISGFTWEQCLGPEADHLSPFTGTDKSTCSCLSAVPYVFIVYYFIKNKNNFIFTFTNAG